MNEEIHGNLIRLLLVDEFALFRGSLGRFLASEPGFEVVGECGTCEKALEILKSVPADVVLFDFDAEFGEDFILAARQAGYEGRFLIVAGVVDARKSALALRLGAAGVFLKSEALDRLLQAIKLVANGELWIDPKIVHLLAERFFYPGHRLGKETPVHLGERERNVLEGIVRGLTNRKIGDGMGLSESSVKNIVQRLFGMTGVKTRGQLVRIALEGSIDTRGTDDHKPEAAMLGRAKPAGSRPIDGSSPSAAEAIGRLTH
jgi:DNA-binding NarL/FixJ family response regulator